jgi:hypothetical protein
MPLEDVAALDNVVDRKDGEENLVGEIGEPHSELDYGESWERSRRNMRSSRLEKLFRYMLISYNFLTFGCEEFQALPGCPSGLLLVCWIM